MANKTLLIITDGIGYNPSCDFNAFCNADTPTYDYLFANVPNSLIHTYGKSVGLPDGQMGNSEVGHMSIGSGRVLYQDLVKINMAIEEDTLKDNSVLHEIITKATTIHLIGLLSDGGVHSHINHTIALAKTIESQGLKVKLHLITDGRDVSPTSATTYIKQIEKIVNKNISIATIGGRFYTMDRDNRWERVKAGYDAIVNATPKTTIDIKEYVASSYKEEITDEFIAPTAFGEYDGIKDGDGVIFTNFRSDRAREIVTAICDSTFSHFEAKKLSIFPATITQYDKSFSYPVMFSKDTPINVLSEVISKAGLTQLHTAETEKYAHVTFFFNGGVDAPFENEERILIPSPNVKTYDMQPQMSAPQVGDAVREGMDQNKDFIVVNFANGDMVGHTGVYEAGIKAVEAVDKEIGLILQKAKERGYNVVITSDHGNCEMMRDTNGDVLTNHTVGDVYCFVIADGVTKIADGGLDNIAPTVLKLIGLDIPSQMSRPLY